MPLRCHGQSGSRYTLKEIATAFVALRGALQVNHIVNTYKPEEEQELEAEVEAKVPAPFAVVVSLILCSRF